jgi:guanylate kinase
MADPGRGRLIIISGPSGVGKSTIVQGLIERCPLPLEVSVSATTRPPRSGEIDGVHYHFLSPEEFARRREAGEFLESANVFGQNWYGTLRQTVASGMKRGKWVILEIDVDGAEQVLAAFPDAASIFIHPGTQAELERRLRGRDTESESAVQRRLEVAQRELAFASKYRFVAVNDDLDQTIAAICRHLCQLGEPEHV